MKRKMCRRIMDIREIDWHTVEVEYFDMNNNHYGYAQRKVQFPHKHDYEGAFINWCGKEEIVEAVFE